MQTPSLHTVATAEVRVSEADLASSLGFEGGDPFPAVFATARAFLGSPRTVEAS